MTGANLGVRLVAGAAIEAEVALLDKMAGEIARLGKADEPEEFVEAQARA